MIKNKYFYFFIFSFYISSFLGVSSFLNGSEYNDRSNILGPQSYSLSINKSNLDKILKLLKKSDTNNRPQKIIKNGKIIYRYKKFSNEPNKSIKQLEELIKNPKSLRKYEKFIRISILSLLSNGVQIQIKEMPNLDLSAQWVYDKVKVIFNWNSLELGTEKFAYLISHEMIHIAQSCKGGGFNSYPVLIGLDVSKIDVSNFESLKSEVYRDLRPQQIQLEIEAYSNQNNLKQTLKLFKYFCVRKMNT